VVADQVLGGRVQRAEEETGEQEERQRAAKRVVAIQAIRSE
jgi:hypothetical protein